jgi:hypothetical protein
VSLPRTIPDRSEWGSLRPSLEPGELRLAELLDDTLPDGWVIAVQAQLWNSRPDVIAYNPEVGLAVFEVKDWDPEARQFRYSSPKDALEARHGPGEPWYVTRNPVGQAIGYRETAQSLYHGDEPARRYVTATVVMTNFPDDHPLLSALSRTVPAWDKQHRETFRVIGREAVEQGRTEELLPAAFDASLQEPLQPRTIQRIESLLTEQEASAQQREPLVLDQRKRELIRNQPSRRRVCGPAGSGKSVLIAASAADAALSGRAALVIANTITQPHHLKDLAVRYRPDGIEPRRVSRAIRDNVRFFYLHEWCEQVCLETGHEKKLRTLIRQNYPHYPSEEIKSLVAVALETRDWPVERSTRVSIFDRVLIDEAQNIDADWFGLLEQVLQSDESDLMVAYDPTQSLYLDEPSWTDEQMPGFSGRPVKLEYTYRLPSSTIPMLTAYCELFLQNEPDIELPIADPQAELLSCELLYRNILGSENLATAVAELVNQLPGGLGIHPGDIAFILWRHKTGMEALAYLTELSPGWQDNITSVFGPNTEMQKRNKKAFWPGSGETKGSTVQSFQGWEAPCVILSIPELGEIEPSDETSAFERNYWKTIYTGLTRVMNSNRGSHLIVVNAEPRLELFLDEWFTAF